MGGPPQFSIVLPLHNGARWVESALESLRRQTYSDFDVIVVDDGSTDDGAARVEGHALATTLLRQPNRGAAVARNVGAAASSGRYLAFIDQDDLWHQDRLAGLADAFEADPHREAIFTSERAFAVEEDKEQLASISATLGAWPERYVSGSDVVEALCAAPDVKRGPCTSIPLQRILSGPVTVTCSVVYKRELFWAAGGMASYSTAADDYVLAASAARLSGLWRLDHATVWYRVHPRSTSRVVQLAYPYLSASTALRWGSRGNEGSARAIAAMEQPLVRQSLVELLVAGHGRDGKWLDSLAFARLLGVPARDASGIVREAIRERLGGAHPLVRLFRRVKRTRGRP
jgi:glycosyltransferase involved in cell wall biosynthesis